MYMISESVRRLAKRVTAQPAADPNEDPMELFGQVRPLLVKMGLANMADRMNTSLVTGQSQGKNSLYRILLRRNSEIIPDTIERIKREIKSLQAIKWTSKAIEVYVWCPYVTPAEEAPVTPKPGAPMATPATP